MKKGIKFVVIVMLGVLFALGMSLGAFANNGNGPNNRPHGDTLAIVADNGSEIDVRIEHRNRAGQFFIIYINGEFAEEVLTDTGTFVTSVTVGNYDLTLSVQGNSLRGGSAMSLEECPGTGEYVYCPDTGTYIRVP